jgi:hypothetical protein
MKGEKMSQSTRGAPATPWTAASIDVLTPPERCRLLDVACARSKRDNAMSLMAYRYGLRASEAGLLQRSDVGEQQYRVRITRLKK